MIAHSECICDDGQSGIDGGARDEKAAVDDVKVVHIMGFAIEIQDRGFGIFAKPHGSVLVPNASQWDLFAKVGVAVEKMMRDAYSIQDHFELLLQSVVSFDVIFCITQLQVAVFGDSDPIVWIGEIFGRQPEIDRVAGHSPKKELRCWQWCICFEHVGIGFA
jgi:hypothetical protein